MWLLVHLPAIGDIIIGEELRDIMDSDITITIHGIVGTDGIVGVATEETILPVITLVVDIMAVDFTEGVTTLGVVLRL